MMRENQLAQIDENANETENTFDDDEEDFPTTELWRVLPIFCNEVYHLTKNIIVFCLLE